MFSETCTLILRKWGWSTLIPVSNIAILTFAPVKPLAHSFSAPNIDVTWDLYNKIIKMTVFNSNKNSITIKWSNIWIPNYTILILQRSRLHFYNQIQWKNKNLATSEAYNNENHRKSTRISSNETNIIMITATTE